MNFEFAKLTNAWQLNLLRMNGYFFNKFSAKSTAMKKKPFALLALFTVLIAASFAFDTAADAPRYKNLKVLPKKTTKEQMDVIMKHFSASLGVKCNFCHVFNQEQKSMDFASDANEHKGIAREMMRMTQKLNKKYFEWHSDWTQLKNKLEVTCYTCHNGKKEPSSWPVIPDHPAGPPPAPTTGPAPAAQQ